MSAVTREEVVEMLQKLAVRVELTKHHGYDGESLRVQVALSYEGEDFSDAVARVYLD